MSEIHQYKFRNGTSPAWYDEGTGPTPDAWHLDCVQPDHIWRTVYHQGHEAGDVRLPEPCAPWRPINELEPSDDLFWFIGQWDGKAWTVDGPRTPQAHGYDADEWDYFCLALSPPTQKDHEAGRSCCVGESWRTEPSNEDWRVGWALAYCGWELYADDGELQDNRELPQIDFARDSAADIRRKIRERAEKHGRIIESAGSYGPFPKDEASTAASTQGDE